MPKISKVKREKRDCIYRDNTRINRKLLRSKGGTIVFENRIKGARLPNSTKRFCRRLGADPRG